MNELVLNVVLLEFVVNFVGGQLSYALFSSVGFTVFLKVNEAVLVDVETLRFKLFAGGLFFLILNKIGSLKKTILYPVL